MIESHQTARQFRCPQCSAELTVESGSQFITCQFCRTTNFVDKTRAVFHYAMQPSLGGESALARLRRWMTGNETVKDLDQKATIHQPRFEFFPMWMIRAVQDDEDRVFWEPAAALLTGALERLTLPAGGLVPYDPAMDEAALLPTVPYETVCQRLADDHGIPAETIREASLVHLPLFRCSYLFGERRFTAIVDAAAGGVFADIYPARREGPFALMGTVAFLLFLLAALIPTLWYDFTGGEGMIIGLGLYVLAALVVAIPLYLAARIVASKL
jgi:hypothetical protein